MFAPDAAALRIKIVFPLYLKSCEWRLVFFAARFVNVACCFFSYCCHSTVAHSEWSMKPPFSVSLALPLLLSLSLISSLCLSRYLCNRVASSMWIRGIDNHFTRAKNRVQCLTKHHITTIKRPVLLLFFSACQLHPRSGRCFSCRMSGINWCFGSRTAPYILS